MAVPLAANNRLSCCRVAGFVAAFALASVGGIARAADEIIPLPVPGESVTPSTLTIGEVSDTACSVLPPRSLGEAMPPTAVDLAALANFMQPPLVQPEEIAPQPPVDETRPFRPITQVTINAALPAGVLPGDPAQPASTTPQVVDPRLWCGWADTMFQWSATALCHRPLYFEQVNLERYGYTVCPLLQPAISGAHFFLTIPTLPYKMAAQCPRECVYTLGYYRAGSPAPRRWHHVNWDPTAATVEGLAVTGLVFLIP
jgi:hypothetical protein